MCRCQFYIYDERKDENYQSGCKMKAKKNILDKRMRYSRKKKKNTYYYYKKRRMKKKYTISMKIAKNSCCPVRFPLQHSFIPMK